MKIHLEGYRKNALNDLFEMANEMALDDHDTDDITNYINDTYNLLVKICQTPDDKLAAEVKTLREF
ncbi:MAG: hypothetical protein LBT79_01755, partial [Elusimicrobiota bacterium]|nr:hypothetical protein [Elusimicrobiota bacterium]